MLATKLHHRREPHVQYKCIVQPLSPQSCVIRSRSGQYLSRRCVQGRRLLGFYTWVQHIRDAYKFVGRERLMALGHTAAINIGWLEDHKSGAMEIGAHLIAGKKRAAEWEDAQEEAEYQEDTRLTDLECARIAGYVSAA